MNDYNYLSLIGLMKRGIGRIRTADTRIFSPLLYLLSYNPVFQFSKSR